MIRVRVPATSANMGPGFDSLGISLKLYNEFRFTELDSGLEFIGIEEEFCNEQNIIYTSMRYCFDKAGYRFKGLKIEQLEQKVPISRGLGSSSTCIVAGLVGANEIMGNKFSTDDLLHMAVEIEGHPDNVAPALLGGMVVAINENGRVYYDKVTVSKELSFVAVVPNFRLSTEKARTVLPNMINLSDGIYNVSRAALLVSSISNGNHRLIKYACKDSFHQPYRSKLINGFEKVYNKAYELGAVGCYLSGAGPTIMCIIDNECKDFTENLSRFLKSESLKWNLLQLDVDNLGANVKKGDYR